MSLPKKIVLVITAFLAFCFLLLGLAGYMYEDKIVAKVMEAINKNLKVKVAIKDVSVSFINHFPKVAVILKRVEIEQVIPDYRPDLEMGLLSVDEIVFKICLLDIFSNSKKLQGVTIKNGWISLYNDMAGKVNYNIFAIDSTESNNSLIDNTVIVLKNVNISYLDFNSGWVGKGLVESGEMNCIQSGDSILAKISFNSQVGLLRHGLFQYMRNQKLKLSTQLFFCDSIVRLSEGKGNLGSNQFSVSGKISTGSTKDVNVSIDFPTLDIETLVALISQNNLKFPPNTKTIGSVALTINAESNPQKVNPISVDAVFTANSIQIKIPQKPLLTFNEIEGSFSNGELGELESAEIKINKFVLGCGSSLIDGNLRIKNLITPIYHLKANHNIYIDDILAWGAEIPIVSGSIKGVTEAIGIIDDLNSVSIKSFENTKFESKVEVSDLCFKEVGRIPNLSGVSGSASFSTEDVCTASLTGKLYGSAFSSDFQVSNATAIVFGNTMANVNANITIDSLNTNWLLKAAPDTIYSKSGPYLWDRIQTISGDVFIDRFIHNKFEARPLSVTLYLKQDYLQSNSFMARSCSGLFSGRFNASKIERGKYNLFADISFDGVNVQRLFESFDSFSQSQITSYNVSGQLDGNLLLATQLIDGKSSAEDVEAIAKTKISNGRLFDLTLLKNLSEQTGIIDLNDIRFTTVESNFLINSQKVIVNNLHIGSPTISLSSSGIHSFNNKYQYGLELSLSNYLIAKTETLNPELKRLGENDKSKPEMMKFYIIIEGDSLKRGIDYKNSLFWEKHRNEVFSIYDSLRSKGKYTDYQNFFHKIEESE